MRRMLTAAAVAAMLATGSAWANTGSAANGTECGLASAAAARQEEPGANPGSLAQNGAPGAELWIAEEYVSPLLPRDEITAFAWDEDDSVAVPDQEDSPELSRVAPDDYAMERGLPSDRITDPGTDVGMTE